MSLRMPLPDRTDRGPAARPALRRLLAGLALGAGLALPASASDEFGPHWPKGETAEEVGYFCSACHSVAIIAQQGLDRKRWDDVLQWMIEDHGMAELDEETYTRFLDFLAESFPESSQKERVPGRG